jgi:glycosyltransferase involved in cell wall biosynthesis
VIAGADAPVPARVLHVLGTADVAGTAASGMVRILAQHLDPGEFEFGACFLGSSGPWVDTLNAAGIHAAHMPWQAPRDVVGALGLWRYLRRREVALLHVHFGGRSVRTLVRAATGAPLVMHAHGRVRNEADLEPTLLRLDDADAVIATSRATAKVVSASRVRVVYPGVPHAAESGVARNPWTIGAAGRLVPIKGYDVLLEAFAALRVNCPAARLEIAGDGPARADLERQAHSLNIVDAVRFLGWREDLTALMSRWAVFVQPSREEALGVTVLHAMASGSCAVASDVGGLPEIVEMGVTGVLVPPANVRALTTALSNLLLEPERRSQLGDAAVVRARQFSESRFAAGIAAVYREVLAQQPPLRRHRESRAR